MPPAKLAQPPRFPAPVTADEASFIKQTIHRFYGEDAVVRNYGPDPSRLALHIETEGEPGMELYDCMGVLMTRIERDQIHLEATKRGNKIRGNAKLAYRQGVVL